MEMRFRRKKLTEDDEFTVDPRGNPFTFGEWHYFVTGLALGFVAGMLIGPVLLFVMVKALGG